MNKKKRRAYLSLRRSDTEIAKHFTLLFPLIHRLNEKNFVAFCCNCVCVCVTVRTQLSYTPTNRQNETN